MGQRADGLSNRCWTSWRLTALRWLQMSTQDHRRMGQVRIFEPGIPKGARVCASDRTPFLERTTVRMTWTRPGHPPLSTSDEIVNFLRRPGRARAITIQMFKLLAISRVTFLWSFDTLVHSPAAYQRSSLLHFGRPFPAGWPLVFPPGLSLRGHQQLVDRGR